jgi:dienelactone hydrolase
MKKIIIVLANSLLLFACAGSSDTQQEASFDSATSTRSQFDFMELEQNDIDEVISMWQSRDLSAKNVEVIFRNEVGKNTVLIVKHTVLSNAHYGAIILPKLMTQEKLPVVLLPDGLNQSNPPVNIDELAEWLSTDTRYSGYVVVFPLIRGRILNYGELTVSAEGDFCDAYDGAADDSIAILNVAQFLVPDGYFEKVVVSGVSRGGNTALLLAARDKRINTVIAIAAPTDFYRLEPSVRYGSQYDCQFFTDKSIYEARQKMVASSPLYHSPLSSVEKVVIHHGQNDNIVPVWNAMEMASKLKSLNINMESHIYKETTHFTIHSNTSFKDNMNSEMIRFKKMISDST